MPSFSVSFVRSGIEFVSSISWFALDAVDQQSPDRYRPYTQDGSSDVVNTPNLFSRTMPDRPANVSNGSMGRKARYFQQAHIVAATVHDAGAQTRIFASIDLAVGLLTLATQVFATGWLLKRFGTGMTAGALPAV